jgi:large subunit ribosomal protein L6
MSRIGKQRIAVPKHVTVGFGSVGKRFTEVLVEGPKGSLSKIVPTKLSQNFHGLTRTLIANMVIGVSVGFEKRLQITGIGYRAQIDGKDLVLNMGYSDSVKMITPEELSVKVETPTTIVVSGMQKDLVGEFAAKIRSVRPPEPYKGKGIAYEGEFIRIKAGKRGKTGKTSK